MSGSHVVPVAAPGGQPVEGKQSMRVDLLTREYPPHVYGGAGVHVTELARVLRAMRVRLEARVHAFGEPRSSRITAYDDLPELQHANAALRTIGTDLTIAANFVGTDLVHSHTWYANLAGTLGALLHDVPHVLSAHSLEPLRPWKAEQLGGGYALSSWAERTAYEGAAAVIAVSAGMREDICAPTRRSTPTRSTSSTTASTPTTGPGSRSPTAAAAGHRPGPPDRRLRRAHHPAEGPAAAAARGRATAHRRPAGALAGAPDTPEIAAEVTGLVENLQDRAGVIWIEEMLPRPEIVAVLAAGTVFVCPSIYEPLGIVNLEAMAFGLPWSARPPGASPRSSTTA